MESTRNVVVTGASSGIGRACVLYLARRGWTVFAGVRKERDGDAVRDEAEGDSPRVIPLMLDVADPGSIRDAAARVSATAPGGLLGLVNNAGISVNGPVELVPLEDWRRQFEVNFFGHIAVTRAMLPLLRAFAAAGSEPFPARIVMMSSIAGRIGQPILGPYCSSKFALEAMSDALRQELHGQRIGVSLVEPGAIKSDIWRKGQEEAAAKDVGDPAAAPYRELVRGITLAAARAESVAIPATTVARVVERCLTASRPPIRVLVGRDAKIAGAAKAVIPLRFIDGLIRFGLRRLASKNPGTQKEH